MLGADLHMKLFFWTVTKDLMSVWNALHLSASIALDNLTVLLPAWLTQLISPTYSLGTLHLVSVWKLSKFFKELWTCCCSADPDSILDKPLKLTYHRQHIAYEFANTLHALQVLLASSRVMYLIYVAANHMTIYEIVLSIWMTMKSRCFKLHPDPFYVTAWAPNQVGCWKQVSSSNLIQFLVF